MRGSDRDQEIGALAGNICITADTNNGHWWSDQEAICVLNDRGRARLFVLTHWITFDV